MPAAAIISIIGLIIQGMKVSSELAPSIANDVTIWRQAFATGNNKKQLEALRTHALNTAAQVAALIAQMRSELDLNRDLVAAQLTSFTGKFSDDGQISTDEFAAIMGLQGVANGIGAGYQRLQALDSLQKQLEAASAVPQETRRVR